MRLLLDENMSNKRLAARLRSAGHDPILAHDLGLISVPDPRVLTRAIGQGLPVLTRDHEDLTDLHDLVVASGGRHPGLLFVRFDNDPGRDLSDRGIATALTNLESSGLPIADQIHVMNHWR